MAERSRLIPSLAAPRGVLGPALGLMTFLLALALGGALGLMRWADLFQERHLHGMDLYLPLLQGESEARMEERERALLDFLNQHESVAAARFVPRETVGDLIAPWLGEDFDAAWLPLPRLIGLRLRVSDLSLRRDLMEEIEGFWPGASGSAESEMAKRVGEARTLVQLLSAIVVACGLFGMGAIVILGARLACMAHRDTIEILLYVGAEEGFIARRLQSWFLLLIFRWGMAGVLLGAAALFALDALAEKAPDALLLLWAGGFVLEPADYAALLLIPVFAALLTHRLVRYHMRRILNESL